MEEFLRKLVREILNEEHGISFEVDRLAEWLTKSFIDDIKSGIQNGTYKFPKREHHILFDVPEELAIETQIYIIVVETDIFNGYEKIDGQFLASKTDRQNDNGVDTYVIYLKLNFDWDFKGDIYTVLYPFFSHELEHAYDYILRFDKPSKSKALNSGIKRIGNGYLQQIIIDNQPLSDFVFNFYLALPEEVNARVHEAFAQIKHNLHLDIDSIIRLLKTKQQFKDAIIMKGYNFNNAITLSEELKNEFITEFNKQILYSLIKRGVIDKDLTYAQKRTNQFFEYWGTRINNNGETLRRKILKMVVAEKEKYDEKVKLSNPDNVPIVNTKVNTNTKNK
jgi:hypothetical protein